MLRKYLCEGEFVYREEELEQQFAGRQKTFNSYAHHIGTTQMSDDPMIGVVDSNRRVRGVDNLYTCGSSAYPTLLAAMLALRLAQKLANKCGKFPSKRLFR